MPERHPQLADHPGQIDAGAGRAGGGPCPRRDAGRPATPRDAREHPPSAARCGPRTARRREVEPQRRARPRRPSNTVTSMQISLAVSSRRSTRPLTRTMASSASLWPCSSITLGNSVTSIESWRSSSTKTPIGSPFFVNLRWSPVTTPPTVSIVALLAPVEVGDGRVGLAAQRRLEAHQRMVRDVQPEHLLLEAQPLDLVELDVGDGDPFGEAVAVAARSPKRLITPWSRSRRRCSVASMICSNTCSRPLRGWPRVSKAPPLMSDSTLRLLSTDGSTRSTKS